MPVFSISSTKTSNSTPPCQRFRLFNVAFRGWYLKLFKLWTMSRELFSYLTFMKTCRWILINELRQNKTFTIMVCKWLLFYFALSYIQGIQKFIFHASTIWYILHISACFCVYSILQSFKKPKIWDHKTTWGKSLLV